MFGQHRALMDEKFGQDREPAVGSRRYSVKRTVLLDVCTPKAQRAERKIEDL